MPGYANCQLRVAEESYDFDTDLRELSIAREISWITMEAPLGRHPVYGLARGLQVIASEFGDPQHASGHG
jgi:hypothetical protein